VHKAPLLSIENNGDGIVEIVFYGDKSVGSKMTSNSEIPGIEG